MAFEGVRPVLHLPFEPSGDQAIADSGLTALVEDQIAAGADGLVALGLASEAWAVTEAERDHVVEVVAAAIAGRVPLVVGLDGTTAVSIARARRAVDRGAAGLMVLPPRQATSRQAMVDHFTRLADAAGVPLLLQDSPQVSGVTLATDTILAIAASHPLVASLKSEIPGAGAKASTLHAEGIEIIAGWGGLGYLEQVERGASGCMPGCDLGPALKLIDRSLRSGDEDTASRLYRQLPLLAFETPSLDLLLLGAKRHLQRRGIFSSAAMRAPARALDAHELKTLDALLDELADLDVPGFEVTRARSMQ